MSVRMTTILFSLTLSACMHSEPALFSYGDQDIYRSDLPAETQKQLFELDMQYYEEKSARLRKAVVDMYIADKVKQTGMPVEDVKKSLISGSENPSEEEMKAFYEREKGAMPYSYEMVKSEIKDWILEKMAEKRENELLKKIENDKKVTLYLSQPTPPSFQFSTEKFPSTRPKHAKVELVEFADFTCPECQKSVKNVKAVLDKYGDSVRFVYKYFPLKFGSASEMVARGGHCAHMQGKFWDYHDYVFNNQFRLAWESPKAIAKKLELNSSDFDKCFDSQESRDIVKESFEEGRRFGVKGTPTFFINGRQVLSGDYSVEGLSQLIEEAM